MKFPTIIEICVETVEAAIAAERGGADRLELCSALSEDGLTPSAGLLHAVLHHVSIPVHAMVRPCRGKFKCTDAVLMAMEHDILHAKKMGAAGVVFGLLNEGNRVDIDHTKHLIQLAAPMEVTFHRAFDLTPDIAIALEELIACGAHRVLTSGGQSNVVKGADAIAALVKQASGRIEIAIGGGLNTTNVADLMLRTDTPQVHASLGLSHSGANYKAELVDTNMILSQQRVLDFVSKVHNTTLKHPSLHTCL